MVGDVELYAAVESEWLSLNFVAFVTFRSILRFLIFLRFLVSDLNEVPPLLTFDLGFLAALAPIGVCLPALGLHERACAHGALAIGTSTYS